ncbi:MAG: prepilin-type N-terminal cleavage/methylation domain-containing protein [Candidatus Pacebacteria bacterium]|jgi:prepilin-type N-terminal cleavage/methylation domain-containing protein|nr:prepilin-type N-terminal cleavage/methylation domain-containing protein [Candidatus Paceibacterota bacterium]MDD5722041.1 prepilin-type N-terminal cleavage/methylation domain-containing protein [Candidatus Paceibacterota bacterium]
MFNINLNFLNNKRKGFTLVEVLVSVGIFVMIVMAISQIYIAVLHSEQVAYALLNSENNIRDNLEFMARAIRMGKEFQVSSDKKEISFEYFSGKQWETVRFYFNESNNNLYKQDLDNNLPLFDSSVTKVQDIRFSIKNNEAESQIIIIIVLEAMTTVKKTDYMFHVETAVTPRVLPI